MINRRTFSKAMGLGTGTAAASLTGLAVSPPASAAAQDGAGTSVAPTAAPVRTRHSPP